MADVAAQTGQVSQMGYAKQTVEGTYVAPTDVLYPTAGSADVTDNPGTVITTAMNGSLDATVAVQPGIHTISGKMSWPGYGLQGQGLIKACLGQDIMSGASSVTFGTGSAATISAGATSFTLTAAPPAVPAGMSSWVGNIVSVDTGANQESVVILGISGDVISCSAFAYAHAAGLTFTIPVEHNIIPNTGATRANLDFMSLVLQYGTMFERQVTDAYISGLTFKGNNQEFSWDAKFVAQSPIVETSTLSTIPASAAEIGDKPFLQVQGGLYTYFTSADTVPTVHNRTTALQWDVSYKVDAEKTGGKAQGVELQVLGERTHKITWTELAGQNAALSTIHSDFVNTGASTPACLYFQNPTTGYKMAVYFPNCIVDKYDPVGPSDKAIAWQGSLTVVPQSGFPICKVVLDNGTTVAL